MSEIYSFKIILVGESEVGKTSLVESYIRGEYKYYQQTTIGVEFSVKTIKLDDNVLVHQQLWDTAGQERFRSIIKPYYRSASGVILMIDITNRLSLFRLNYWFNVIKNNCPLHATIILVGNKIDNERKREITEDEVKELINDSEIADRIINYIEVSAKKNININEVFRELSTEIYQKYKNNPGISMTGIKLHIDENKISDKGSCC